MELPLKAIIILAACIAIAGIAPGDGARSVNAGENPAQAAAIQPSLTLEQLSHLDQKTFEKSLRLLRQVMEQASPTLCRIVKPWPRSLPNCGNPMNQLRNTGPPSCAFLLTAVPKLAHGAPPPGQQPRALSDILSPGIMRGIREEGRTILLDSGNLGNGGFTNCRIIFTANPVQMQNVVFRNCVFEFPTADPPDDYIKKVSRALLASKLDSVSIATL